MMGALNGKELIAIETKTPEQRRAAGVRGWNKPSVLSFIRKRVAKFVRDNEISGAVVVIDKALRISVAEVKAAMIQGRAEGVGQPVIMPPATAKFISPLDNTLWHQLKDKIRAHSSRTANGWAQVIRNEWQAITPEQIHNYYKHCALTARSPLDKGR